MAKAESDYTADNFLQWFIKEQLEEVASMGQLLRVVQRAGECHCRSDRDRRWYLGAIGPKQASVRIVS